MALEPWVYATMFGFALLQVLVVVYGFRHGRSTTEGATEVETDGGTVECTTCGAENDSEYRFCRQCVSELPGAVERATTGASPQGRGIF